MISFLAFFFVLGVLVVIHEAGHFLMARALGAPVEVFSVGFGKRLWGFERGGTDYRISLIPFGGYVRIVGLGPDESDVIGDEAEEVDLMPRWKRALILFAGPITNVVAAVFFFAMAFMIGYEVPSYLEDVPVIGWVETGSPAAEAGLEIGDLVLAVDDSEIVAWRDLEMTTLTAGGREINVSVDRNGELLDISFTPEKISRNEFGYSGIRPPLDPVIVQLLPNSPAQRSGLEVGDRILAVNDEELQQLYDLIRLVSPHAGEEITMKIDRDGMPMDIMMTPQDNAGRGVVGIGLLHQTAIRKLGPIDSMAAGFVECQKMTIETFRILSLLVRGQLSVRQVSGPIGIAQISGQAAKSGVNALVGLMAMISLQLGIFNLLPIPILDGGHLTIIAFESVIRRDLSLKLKERILEVGFYALMLLMVVVVFNDIVKLLPENIYNFFTRG